MTETEGPQRIIAKVSPSYNKEEYLSVYNCLFSESLCQRQWALDRINVWKCRSYPALPTAVDATAALVRSMVRDEHYKLGLSDSRLPDISLMYSSALIRFVSLLTECIQSNINPYPVHVASRKLDIPEWIVNLRHRASHSSIPNISMLRKGAEIALQWLKNKYWTEMCSSFTDCVPDQESVISLEARIIALITGYFDSQVEFLRSADKASRKINRSRRNIVVNEIKNLLENKSNEFLDILIQPSHFLNTSEDMHNILPEDDFNYLMTNEDLNLPLSLVQLWAPMIQLINSKYLIQEFVLKLLMKQKDMVQIHQRLACAWAWKLINILLNSKSFEDSDPLLMIYKERNWWFEWYVLISVCAMSPSMYMPAILPQIVDCAYPPLSEGQKNSLMGALAIYLGTVPQMIERNDEEVKIRTWEELQDDVELEVLTDEEGSVPYIKNKWVKAPADIDWGSLPLGHVLSSEFIPPIPDPEDNIMDVSAGTEHQDKESSNVSLKNEASKTKGKSALLNLNFPEEKETAASKKLDLSKVQFL